MSARCGWSDSRGLRFISFARFVAYKIDLIRIDLRPFLQKVICNGVIERINRRARNMGSQLWRRKEHAKREQLSDDPAWDSR